MENFNYYNPVKVLFGEGKIAEIANYIPKTMKVMMTYGGGSIKKNGVYDQVMDALKGMNVIEFGGIEPNPHYETLMKAVEIARQENVGFLLAVGGGSVIDGTKFIAAATCYDGEDPWDIVLKGTPVKGALPLAAVLTLPATGSEMNNGGVITRVSTQEKLAFHSPLVFPKFSVLDPKVTYSLPKRQLANGIVDTFVHVMEQYYTTSENVEIQDRFSEGILQTLLVVGPRVMADEQPNYQDRANFMWAATMGLNGLIAVGTEQDWSTHYIGHELTAFHGLDHGVTLAIVLPGVMRATKENRKRKLLQFASRVWGIDATLPDAAEQAIARTEQFFNSLGVKTRLGDYGVGMETVERIEKRFRDRGNYAIGGIDDVNVDNVREILVSRL